MTDKPEIIRDPDHLKPFLGDASGIHGEAEGVAHPTSIEGVQELLVAAAREGATVTVAGAGTGLAGGRVPQGGIVLATDHLRSPLEFDPERRVITADVGYHLHEIQEYASSLGMLYPPDPTESLAQIGGNLATNASGARTYYYGPTREWVDRLTMVLADGEILDLRRGESVAEDGRLVLKGRSGSIYELTIPEYLPPATSKNAAGYYLKQDVDAVDLFVGSEGTLGVIVRAGLRVIPAPEGLFGGLLFFEEEDRMLDFVEELRRSPGKISPRCIEFIDGAALDVIRPAHPSIPEAASGGAIWFEQEGEDMELLEAWDSMMRGYSGLVDSSFFGLDARHHQDLRAIRHAVPTTVHEILAARGVRKYGTDMAVPDDRFREMFQYYRDYLGRSGLESMIWGHIGNSHLHVNILPRNPSEEKSAKQAYDAFVVKALNLGGTVSAEHGIGKIKRDYLVQMLGPDVIAGMRHIRDVLDPENRLGNGTIFTS